MTKRPPKGIPTLYKGVQFRSRTEARWAAFFDAVHWQWDYEPVDLDGYIPDFVLPFRYKPLLVEVKATNSYQVKRELMPHTRKVMSSKWDQEAWIVGSRIDELGGGTEFLCGLLGSREPSPERSRYVRLCGGALEPSVDDGLEWLWDDACLFWCVPCRGVSVAQFNGSWRCRRCGVDDGQQRGFDRAGTVGAAWAEAGNAVQWRAPK